MATKKPAKGTNTNLNGSWFSRHDDSPGQMVEIVQKGNSVVATYTKPRVCLPAGPRELEQFDPTANTTLNSFTATLQGNKLTGNISVCRKYEKDGEVINCLWGGEEAEMVVNEAGTQITGSWYNSEEKKTVGFTYEKREKKVEIVELNFVEWTCYKNGKYDKEPLKYLSVGKHSYHGGKTIVYGSIKLKVEKDAWVDDVVLEVLENDEIVVFGRLGAEARAALIRHFSEPDTIEFGPHLGPPAPVLFEIPSELTDGIGCGDWDSSVKLRVRVSLKDGADATKDYGDVLILVPFHHPIRQGDPDPQYGGDNWARPPVLEFLKHYKSITVYDISNMNGGPFEPHEGHRDGVEFDLNFNGYTPLTEITVKKLISYLNVDRFGSWIERVYVDPTVNNTPENIKRFRNAVKSAVLKDGRLGPEVIVERDSHHHHCHWSLSPPGSIEYEPRTEVKAENITSTSTKGASKHEKVISAFFDAGGKIVLNEQETIAEKGVALSRFDDIMAKLDREERKKLPTNLKNSIKEVDWRKSMNSLGNQTHQLPVHPVVNIDLTVPFVSEADYEFCKKKGCCRR